MSVVAYMTGLILGSLVAYRWCYVFRFPVRDNLGRFVPWRGR